MHEIEELSERIWAWRAVTQPRARDDIPRLERPAGWLPQLTAGDRDRQRTQRDAFAAELDSIVPVAPADVVDHRLLRSALQRVTWELDIIRVWAQPRFWVDQALGPVFDVLLPPGVDQARVAEVVRFLANVPSVVEEALDTLPMVAEREFAESAAEELRGVDERLAALGAALVPLAPDLAPELARATEAAATALTALRAALESWLPDLPPWQPVGTDRYEWFLREVACVPLTAAEIDAIGRREHQRAVVLERFEAIRNAGVPEPPLPPDAATQIAREHDDELAVRRFYVERGLLSQPEGLQHYRNRPMPDYLEPLRFLGVTDDLTGPSRLDHDGTAYVPAPAADLPYFYAANARDPRAGIVHEGVHYQQLAWSWAAARPVRRHYYDSSANEGIAFYNEELMLATGLFDDAPHSRSTMLNFMRLRALRVVVDVGLATGRLSVEQAAEVLRVDVPMDAATAVEEARFFAETPGQALTYQIGKTQLIAFVADAMRELGDGFDLQAVHDFVWVNGNVPIALQRYELLGLSDELAGIGIDIPSAGARLAEGVTG